MITYLQGDLLDPQWGFNVIVHGANCFHTMNSGVAKAIVDKYPEALEADIELTKKGDRDKLGKITVASTGEHSGVSPLIVNAYTQYNYGKEEGMVYVSYNAIRSAMEEVKKVFAGPEYKIGMPKIGSGLGGGDWAKIEAIINEVFPDKEIFVVVKD